MSPNTGLTVELNGVEYAENDEIDMTLIGTGTREDQSGLLCRTNLTGCCRSWRSGAQGGWHYPDNTLVGVSTTGLDFYRNRGYDGIVRLNRRNGATEPTGSYCCEVGTMADPNARICVTLSKLFVLY